MRHPILHEVEGPATLRIRKRRDLWTDADDADWAEMANPLRAESKSPALKAANGQFPGVHKGARTGLGAGVTDRGCGF